MLQSDYPRSSSELGHHFQQVDILVQTRDDSDSDLVDPESTKREIEDEV